MSEVSVSFHYFRGLEPNPQKEKVVIRTVNILCAHLALPKKIRVEFVGLGPGTHAETILYPLRTESIRLNNDLGVSEIVIPTVHELIHLDQMQTGRLSADRFGHVIWDGRRYKVKPNLSYEEYANLHWESDVIDRQCKLLNLLFQP